MPDRQKSLYELSVQSKAGNTNPLVRDQLDVYSRSETLAALTTDINNLDISLTQKISEECMLSEGVSGAGTTISGHIIVTINGTQYKIAVVA